MLYVFKMRYKNDLKLAKEKHAFTNDPLFSQIEECFNFLILDNFTNGLNHIKSHSPIAIFRPTNLNELETFRSLAKVHNITFSLQDETNTNLEKSQQESVIIVDLKKLSLLLKSSPEDLPDNETCAVKPACI